MLRKFALFCSLAASTAAFSADGTVAVQDPVARWEADRSIVFSSSEIDLDAFKWIARPVVIFADSPADPAFQRQIELLSARLGELAARDVVLITDTAPDERSALRGKLRPRGFMLTLIGKDGLVKLRKPFPWDVRELTRSIDKMPMRLEEVRERQSGG